MTDIGHPTSIACAGIARNSEEYRQILASSSIQLLAQFEDSILASVTKDEFKVHGWCLCCRASVSFHVDFKSGGERHGSRIRPNWRERLVCPLCGMNSRQRLIATLVNKELLSETARHVYFMEQITPIFAWASNILDNHVLTGSEYLGPEYIGGTRIRPVRRAAKLFLRCRFAEAIQVLTEGIRHQDIEKLSFANETFDLIVSNDVFEHVPNYLLGFSECGRVLKPGGMMIATLPFHGARQESVCRARIINGKVQYLLPPVFHGNPVSVNGSLVFTDFGWDLIHLMKSQGFSDAYMGFYAAPEFGHLGDALGVLFCIK